MDLFFVDDDAHQSELDMVKDDPTAEERIERAKAPLRAAQPGQTPYQRVFRADGVTLYALEIDGGGIILWRPFPEPDLVTAAAIVYVGPEI